MKEKKFILGLMGLNKLNLEKAEKFILDAIDLGIN